MKTPIDTFIRSSEFSRIKSKLTLLYCEERRFYHNVNHIHQMMEIGDNEILTGDDIHIFTLATWYHDAIYDPTRNDNELMSSAMMRRDLTPHIDDSYINQISDWTILSNHKTQSKDLPDSHVKLFLDADLMCLSRPEDGYDEYANAIHKEYSHVSDVDYINGRLQFLRGMLTRQIFSIYLDLESRAKMNISREIESLFTGRFLGRNAI